MTVPQILQTIWKGMEKSGYLPQTEDLAAHFVHALIAPRSDDDRPWGQVPNGSLVPPPRPAASLLLYYLLKTLPSDDYDIAVNLFTLEDASGLFLKVYTQSEPSQVTFFDVGGGGKCFSQTTLAAKYPHELLDLGRPATAIDNGWSIYDTFYTELRNRGDDWEDFETDIGGLALFRAICSRRPFERKILLRNTSVWENEVLQQAFQTGLSEQHVKHLYSGVTAESLLEDAEPVKVEFSTECEEPFEIGLLFEETIEPGLVLSEIIVAGDRQLEDKTLMDTCVDQNNGRIGENSHEELKSLKRGSATSPSDFLGQYFMTVDHGEHFFILTPRLAAMYPGKESRDVAVLL